LCWITLLAHTNFAVGFTHQKGALCDFHTQGCSWLTFVQLSETP
jgi:hypothetical protein